MQEGAYIRSIQQEQWQVKKSACLSRDAYAAALQLVGVWTMQREAGMQMRGWYVRSQYVAISGPKEGDQYTHNAHTRAELQAGEGQALQTLVVVVLLGSLAGPTTMPHAVNNKGENFQLTLPIYYFCLSAGCRSLCVFLFSHPLLIDL